MALVTPGDFLAVLLRLIDEKKGPRVLRRLFSSTSERVRLTWDEGRPSVRNWYDIPRILTRQNKLVTGDEGVSTYEYVARAILGRSGLSAVSLGCGTGSREIEWAQTGCFNKILAMDISESRIGEARAKLERTSVAGVVDFIAADILRYPFQPDSCDVVIAEGILHHLSPLQDVFDKIVQMLRPGGLFIMNDYIGPDRFQWGKEQVRFCDILLRFIPDELRTYRGTSITKKRVWRPGTLSMRFHDPSEAVEPSGTMAFVGMHFPLLFRRDYGGTILQPLLKDIAHHFVQATPQSEAVLQFLFDAEDYLMKSGMIGSDFTFLVGRKE